MERQSAHQGETVAFTHQWYRGFLDRLDKRGYSFGTFGDELDDRTVLLRHDVDLSLASAMTMARIEADRGVQATYCIMVSSPLYNPLTGKWRDRVRAIRALGHEVGLHFSTHEYWGGEVRPDEKTLTQRVDAERSVLETVSAVAPEVVSFHIPPDWVLDRTFDGFENTYASGVFSDIEYVADSGQRWRENPPVVGELPEQAQVLTHPGLWGETDEGFEDRIKQRVVDSCSQTNRKATREFLDQETNDDPA